MDEKPLISPAYRQKSKLFLWPLLKLERAIGLRPIQTFIIDKEQGIHETDYKIIAPFNKKGLPVEEEMLLNHEFLDGLRETEELLIYTFDLSDYKEDFDIFLEGRYSKFSKATKTLINMYWGSSKGLDFIPHSQIKAYLSPNESVYMKVAKQLDIDVYELIKGVEIIDPPDLLKEVFNENKVIKPTNYPAVPE